MKNTLFLLLALVALSACSTQARHYKRASAPAWGSDYWAGRGGSTDKDEAGSTFTAGQLIIYNARMEITAKNIDTANARIVSVAKKYEGFVVSVSNSFTSIRVKSENLNQAMKELESVGKVTSKNVYGEDVTMEYNNLNIRLDNANKARQRYLELLAKAEDVKAALEVEKELERLNKEIDVLEMELSNMSKQIDYSLIEISLQERKQPGILGYVFIGLYKSVKWLFVWN